ncbi:acyl-CoA desaturase-like [Thrips palmi]|uniref:Acyl-CoA desaturase-like n=1 Tax=Thrips palmi TaxID=161013 RepID=A0A6P9ADK7_THRPL|nr:acyl-CoA desaturase-like [Thrips palmi]
MTFQYSIYEWARNHRVHHKFMDTDVDPHNIKRGFFFAHVGWLMVHKHPDVRAKGKIVDVSDLEADPIVMFQKRYYYTLMVLFAFVMPTAVPWLLWGEDPWTAW